MEKDKIYNMEDRYIRERARLVNEALKLDRRFYPRCFRARIRYIARLDAEHDGTDFEATYNRLLKEWND